MKANAKLKRYWMIAFVLKALAWIAIPDLVALSVLWALGILNLLVLILVYESAFVLSLGTFQILSSHIYRDNGIPSRFASRTGWFDFRKFSKLKPEERLRYRQEGKILVVMGLGLLLGVTVVLLFDLTTL